MRYIGKNPARNMALLDALYSNPNLNLKDYRKASGQLEISDIEIAHDIKVFWAQDQELRRTQEIYELIVSKFGREPFEKFLPGVPYRDFSSDQLQIIYDLLARPDETGSHLLH